MDKYSFLNAANTQFFADLYDQYLENPDSVEASWRAKLWGRFLLRRVLFFSASPSSGYPSSSFFAYIG